MQNYTKMDKVQQSVISWKKEENKNTDNMHNFGIYVQYPVMRTNRHK